MVYDIVRKYKVIFKKIFSLLLQIALVISKSQERRKYS